MKYLIISIILIASSSIMAKPCDDFKQAVLITGVTEDPEVSKENNEHPYRFIRTEKDALISLGTLDMKKLGLDQNKELRIKELQICGVKEHEKYCANTFPLFNYFRGLIHGLKNYVWTPSTNALAIRKIRDYVHEAVETRSSLLDLNLAVSLLSTLSSEKLIEKPEMEKISKLRKEMEDANKRLHALVKEKKTKALECKDSREIALMEDEMINIFAIKLGALTI